jgi:hypothetical protein
MSAFSPRRIDTIRCPAHAYKNFIIIIIFLYCLQIPLRFYVRLVLKHTQSQCTDQQMITRQHSCSILLSHDTRSRGWRLVEAVAPLGSFGESHASPKT